MYDPEFNLFVENLIKKIQDSTDNIKNTLGKNHYLTKICKSFEGAFAVLEQMRNDYDNCFDETKREIMLKDIRKAIAAITAMWKQVLKAYKL